MVVINLLGQILLIISTFHLSGDWNKSTPDFAVPWLSEEKSWTGQGYLSQTKKNTYGGMFASRKVGRTDIYQSEQKLFKEMLWHILHTCWSSRGGGVEGGAESTLYIMTMITLTRMKCKSGWNLSHVTTAYMRPHPHFMQLNQWHDWFAMAENVACDVPEFLLSSSRFISLNLFSSCLARYKVLNNMVIAPWCFLLTFPQTFLTCFPAGWQGMG